MKEFILFFFAMFFTLWLSINVIAGMVQTIKFGQDNVKSLNRFILIILCSVFWALIYAL